MHCARQEFPPPAGDGIRIQAEELGQQGVASMTAFETFQSREEAALLFIQQAVEQDHRRLEFFGLSQGKAGGPSPRERLGFGLPRQALLLLSGSILGAIEPAVLQRVAAEPTPFYEGAQRIFDRNVEGCFQLTDEVTGRSRRHPRHQSVEQRALAGEPSVPAVPQALSIELSDGGQCVIGPAMGIAGEIGKRSQLAKDRQVDLGAQGGLELWESSDWMPLEETPERLGIEEKRAHNVMILPSLGSSGVFITLQIGLVKDFDGEIILCFREIGNGSTTAGRACQDISNV